YIYIWSFGLILFLGCIGAYSRIGRILLLFLLIFLFYSNFCPIFQFHKQLDSLVVCQKLEAEGIISKNDVFLVQEYDKRKYSIKIVVEPNSFIYYFFVDKLEKVNIDESPENQDNFNKLITGELPLVLSESIKAILNSGRKIFINEKIWFGEPIPGDNEAAIKRKCQENIWKAFKSQFILKDAFTCGSDSYFRFYNKNAPIPGSIRHK
ncbi:MAG: hypothetical protein PHS17_18110, partial [Desulfobacterales bacterium]|nr:hypothetical protein [Desulfobacterales bacterium]